MRPGCRVDVAEGRQISLRPAQRHVCFNPPDGHAMERLFAPGPVSVPDEQLCLFARCRGVVVGRPPLAADTGSGSNRRSNTCPKKGSGLRPASCSALAHSSVLSATSKGTDDLKRSGSRCPCSMHQPARSRARSMNPQSNSQTRA